MGLLLRCPVKHTTQKYVQEKEDETNTIKINIEGHFPCISMYLVSLTVRNAIPSSVCVDDASYLCRKDDRME